MFMFCLYHWRTIQHLYSGAVSILDQFPSEFDLCSKLENPETLPFNKQGKEFSLKEGRAHVEFAQMMSQHKENMTTMLFSSELQYLIQQLANFA